jgi:hypothetical protein
MAGRNPGTPKSGGRQAGTPNKIGADLKAMILGALDAVDGQAYFEKIAREDPKTFCSLVAKLLPTTLASGDADNPIEMKITRIELVAPHG